jgi:hypothetical protein
MGRGRIILATARWQLTTRLLSRLPAADVACRWGSSIVKITSSKDTTKLATFEQKKLKDRFAQQNGLCSRSGEYSNVGLRAEVRLQNAKQHSAAPAIIGEIDSRRLIGIFVLASRMCRFEDGSVLLLSSPSKILSPGAHPHVPLAVCRRRQHRAPYRYRTSQ